MEQIKQILSGLRLNGEDVSINNSCAIARDCFLNDYGYIRSRGGLDPITLNFISDNILENNDGLDPINTTGNSDGDLIPINGSQVELVNNWKVNSTAGESHLKIDSDGFGIDITTAYNSESDTNKGSQMIQYIADGASLVNRTITFTANIKANVPVRLVIYSNRTLPIAYELTYSDYHTGGGDVETLTVTQTVFSNAMNVSVIVDMLDTDSVDGAYYAFQSGNITYPYTSTSISDSRIDGLYYWSSKNWIMCVSGRHLYKIDENNLVTDLGSGLEANARASFAVVRTASGVESLAVANEGSDLFIYDPINDTFQNIYNLDNDCPRNIKQIAFLDQYLLILPQDSRFFHYSVVGDPENWSALDFGVAEAAADDIVGMIVDSGYIYLLGEISIEAYYNDGSTPFSRIGSTGYINSGCASPFTFKTVDNNILFLDNQRRISTINGSNFNEISVNIANFLQKIDDISDAFAFPLIHQGHNFYFISFPNASRTNYDNSSSIGVSFVFDLKTKEFFEFSRWNTTTSQYDIFNVFCQTFAVSRKQQLLGSSENDGKIFLLDETKYQDDGEILRPIFYTSLMDFGTLNKKRINEIRCRFLAGTSTVPTILSINARKDGNAVFEEEQERQLEVGTSSLNQSFLQISNLGIARIFQFQFYSSTDSPLTIGDIYYYVEPMTN